MFADIEGAGLVAIEEVLFEFVPSCRVWQGSGDRGWLCPFGALAVLWLRRDSGAHWGVFLDAVNGWEFVGDYP